MLNVFVLRKSLLENLLLSLFPYSVGNYLSDFNQDSITSVTSQAWLFGNNTDLRGAVLIFLGSLICLLIRPAGVAPFSRGRLSKQVAVSG